MKKDHLRMINLINLEYLKNKRRKMNMIIIEKREEEWMDQILRNQDKDSLRRKIG